MENLHRWLALEDMPPEERSDAIWLEERRDESWDIWD